MNNDVMNLVAKQQSLETTGLVELQTQQNVVAALHKYKQASPCWIV